MSGFHVVVIVSAVICVAAGLLAAMVLKAGRAGGEPAGELQPADAP